MTVLHELDQAREDLEAVLADVLRVTFGEEPCVLPAGVQDAAHTWPEPSAGGTDADHAAPIASAVLAIRDDTEGIRLGVRLCVPATLAHRLAARMFASDEPTSDDVLDALGELANIAGGNVKALLFTSARLSLPSATLGPPALAPRDPQGALAMTLRALVLGEVAELTLVPHLDGDDLLWPPTLSPDALERQL
ncbi:MAG: chemotaxis protein CheX [Kineosporiaceae bacterium]